MPYQVIYSSAATTPLQQEDLHDLLTQARRSNARSGITGALAYVDGCFLQVLEGQAEAVQALMARITTDLRHETLTVLQAGEIAAPAFTDWQMAYVSATAAQIAEWAGLSARTELPETLEALRRDREKTMQVSKSILAMLMDEAAPDEPRG
jgi:hypothetical protein